MGDYQSSNAFQFNKKKWNVIIIICIFWLIRLTIYFWPFVIFFYNFYVWMLTCFTHYFYWDILKRSAKTLYTALLHGKVMLHWTISVQFFHILITLFLISFLIDSRSQIYQYLSLASGLGVVLTKPFSTSKSLNLLCSYMCTKNDMSVTLLYSTIDTIVKMGWIFPEAYLQQIYIQLKKKKKKKGISVT